jgi:single-strand DNA-binding protein
MVYVEGRLKTDKWQDKQTGQDRYKVKVVADTVRFLGGGRGEGAGRGPRPAAEEPGAPGPAFEDNGAPPPAGGEDIPF